MQVFESIEAFPARSGTAPGAPRFNRRLLAFLIVFLLVALAGLGFTFLRTPEYRATARLEITPAEGLQARAPAPGTQTPASAGSERGAVSGSPFLTEIEFLTSRPLLEQVVERLRNVGLTQSLAGQDPVAALLQAISAAPVAGTQLVQLTAVGEKPDVLAPALNGLMDIYRAAIADRYRDTANEAVAQAREEAQKYDLAVAEKRRTMEAFRVRHSIVSLEREENEALARVRGLGTSINAAEEKAVAAEAKLQSMRDAVASGKGVVRAKDNPTLANLETRLSQAREEWRQLERNFTEDYLNKDPAAKLLRTRIGELEAQVKRERAASQETNLAEAEEEARQTRDNLEQLKRRLTADRSSVQAFSARFSEYKALQEELTTLEGLLRGAREKAVRLEASDRARRPEARIIEAAITPTEPWRPLYLRDSAITLGAAVALGVLAAWVTAFLTRREGAPSVIVAPAAVPYPIPSLTVDAQARVPGQAALQHGNAPLQLPPVQPVLRELDDDEVMALMSAADDAARVVIAALASGVAPEELLALTWGDVDVDAKAIHISAPHPREFVPGAELLAMAATAIAADPKRAGAAPVIAAHGHAIASADDLAAVIACASHDAGLAQAADITPADLRHMFLAYMARQGVRFSELTRIVGPLQAQAIGFYGALAPVGARRSINDVGRVLPGLRQWFEKTTGQPARH